MADVNFSIGADSGAFFGELKKVQKGLGDLGQAFIGLQGVAATLQTAFAAMMGPIREFGALENVRTQMGVMMGSAEAAGALTEKLQDLATNGVVSLDALLAASRPLANMMSGDEIAVWVGRFADIAAASKIPAERLASMVARLNDMGKAEFTELANAGIPIFEALGEVVGASREELVRMSAEGKISAEEFLQAIEKLTAEGGRFYQMNSQMSNTTLGSLATLEATWKELMAEVGRPLAEFLTPVVQQVIRLFDELKPVLSEAMDRLGEFLQRLMTDGGAGTERAREMGEVLMGVFGGLLDALEPVVAVQQQLAEVVRGALLPLLGALAPLSEHVAVQLRGVGMVLELLGPLVEALLLPLEVQCEVFGELMGLLGGVSGGLGASAEGMDRLGESVKSVTALLGGGVGALREFLRVGREAIGLRKPERGQTADADAALAETVARAQVLAAEKVSGVQKKAEREAKAAAEARMKMEDVVSAHYQKAVEKQAEAIKDLGMKYSAMLKAAGFDSMEALQAEMRALQELENPTAGQVEHMRVLLALEEKLMAVEKQRRMAARDAAAEAAKARAEAEAEYEKRRQAERDAAFGKHYEGLSVAEQRAWLLGEGSAQMTPGEVSAAQVRADMDYLAAEDAVKYAGMIAGMEEWLAKWQKLEERAAGLEQRRAAEEAELRAREADAAGHGALAESLRRAAANRERMRELMDAGYGEDEARERVRREAKLNMEEERRARMDAARVEVVQASLASVGGGGGSIRIGDMQFREAQKQTDLLARIKEALVDSPQSKQMLAVLA